MLPMVTAGSGGFEAAFTVIVICAVAVCLFESVAVTVTVAVPATVGVPPITPLVNVKPVGRVPFVMDHVYGEDPPVAVRF